MYNLPTKKERAKFKARYAPKPNWDKCSLLWNNQVIVQDVHVSICKNTKKRLSREVNYKGYLHLFKIVPNYY